MRDQAVVGYRQPIAPRKQSVPTRGELVRVALRMLRGIGSLGGVLVALLLPKCPLCVAAVLTGAGVGAAAAGVLAPYLKPAGCALSLVLFVAVLLRERSAMAKRARAQSCCCSQASAEER
jgi:hypothetical protein